MISDNGLENLQELSLTSLDLGGLEITDEGLKFLFSMPLTTLSIAGSLITDLGLDSLRSLTSLTSLNIDWCNGISQAKREGFQSNRNKF